MFAVKRKNIVNWFSVVVLISLIYSATGRQIRYNRNQTEVIEDNLDFPNSNSTSEYQTEGDENEIEAIVREITSYPASNFKPSSPFPLPNKLADRNIQEHFEVQVTDTTEVTSVSGLMDFTTATPGYESETTSINSIEHNHIVKKYNSEEIPPDNFFNSEKNFAAMPTELYRGTKVKAAYPAAGYRPSKPFFLPSEQLQLQGDNIRDGNPKDDNSKHPICGSSTHPLAPKPLDTETPDPDSESVNISTAIKKKISQ